MKRNWLILLIFVSALFVMELSYWHTTTHKKEKSPAESKSTTPSEIITNGISTIASNSIVAQIEQVASVTNQPLTPRELQVQQAVARRNIPVSFFGRLIDQDGNPVSGVKISVSVLHLELTATTIDRTIHLGSESDLAGRFEIQGATGDGFDVDYIGKTGYQLSPKTPNHFSPINGSAENPVIIRMWRKLESAQLISQDKDTRIPYDGTPVVFDLLAGQKNVGGSSGDLRVTLIRNPLDITTSRRGFEWHATIEALNGGLIQSDDDFMYEAPIDGYQPRIQIDMPANAAKWASIYGISFFAKTRDGQVYSRVRFEFRVDSLKPQTGFTITSAANPNGSRNLQP